MSREKISNVENLSVIGEHFKNVKVNTKTILFGKKIFGAPIFELAVESFRYGMYGIISEKIKRLNGKTTNRVIFKLMIVEGKINHEEQLKILNKSLVETIFSYEKIKQLKEIEEVTEEETNVDGKTRKEQFEAAMVMLKMDDKAHQVFVNNMYYSFKTLPDMTYFTYKEHKKETTIHSYFQKLANKLDLVFDKQFGSSFKAYTGFDVYEYRNEILNNYFTISYSKKRQNYVAVLTL